MKELLASRTLPQFLLASANGTKSRLRITLGAAKLANALHHFATPRIKELSTLLALSAFPNNPAFHAEAIDRNVRIDLSILRALLRLPRCVLSTTDEAPPGPSRSPSR